MSSSFIRVVRYSIVRSKDLLQIQQMITDDAGNLKAYLFFRFLLQFGDCDSLVRTKLPVCKI